MVVPGRTLCPLTLEPGLSPPPRSAWLGQVLLILQPRGFWPWPIFTLGLTLVRGPEVASVGKTLPKRERSLKSHTLNSSKHYQAPESGMEGNLSRPEKERGLRGTELRVATGPRTIEGSGCCETTHTPGRPGKGQHLGLGSLSQGCERTWFIRKPG